MRKSERTFVHEWKLENGCREERPEDALILAFLASLGLMSLVDSFTCHRRSVVKAHLLLIPTCYSRSQLRSALEQCNGESVNKYLVPEARANVDQDQVLGWLNPLSLAVFRFHQSLLRSRATDPPPMSK